MNLTPTEYRIIYLEGQLNKRIARLAKAGKPIAAAYPVEPKLVLPPVLTFTGKPAIK